MKPIMPTYMFPKRISEIPIMEKKTHSEMIPESKPLLFNV